MRDTSVNASLLTALTCDRFAANTHMRFDSDKRFANDRRFPGPAPKGRGRVICWEKQGPRALPPMISALLPNYARADLAFERGEGAWLWTGDGRRLLDFGAGIATASLGHGHPHLVKAIADQAAKVMHTSNLYRIPQAERLAQRLVDATFADSVFFCNSGAEANEGMIKMMRRAMSDASPPSRRREIPTTSKVSGRLLRVSTTCHSTT
jgi:acetylornithine/succinyldiaminopimelate/putrescine aminotransferase